MNFRDMLACQQQQDERYIAEQIVKENAEHMALWSEVYCESKAAPKRNDDAVRMMISLYIDGLD